jgi:hypothetical protein
VQKWLEGRWRLATGLAWLLAGCVPPQTGYDAQGNNPLGPSFWIVATPSDDEGLLGRKLVRPPDAALTLEEQSAPNPCASALLPRSQAQMPNHYENAIDTSQSARGSAQLATYGFAAQAQDATHLLYKVSTSTKVTRLDTTEYEACCRQNDCGWGYVQSLVYGEGEYAAGRKSELQAQGNYTVLSGGVAKQFQVTNTKKIRGYLAAVLVAHDRSQAVQACSAGQEWASIECVPKGALAESEKVCRSGVREASDPFWADNDDALQRFRRDQLQACDFLSAHGGPRIDPPLPDALRPQEPPALGDYVAVDTFWKGTVTLRSDGTLTTDDGRTGKWRFDGRRLTLSWDSGLPDELRRIAPGVYEERGHGLKLQSTAVTVIR